MFLLIGCNSPKKDKVEESAQEESTEEKPQCTPCRSLGRRMASIS